MVTFECSLAHAGLLIATLFMSLFNFVRYINIWRGLRSPAATIMLFCPILSAIISIYYLLIWTRECLPIEGLEISDLALGWWRGLEFTLLLLFSLVQTMVLFWRPSWFRRQRSADRR